MADEITSEEAPPLATDAQSAADEGSGAGAELENAAVNTEAAPEPNPETARINKLLQREQQERANMRREFGSKIDKVLELVQSLGSGSHRQQEDRLAKAEAVFSGERAAEIDAASGIPGFSTAMQSVLEELRAQRESGRGGGQEARELVRKAETLVADANHKEYFSRFPAKYRDDFVAEQLRAQDEEGITDPGELRGYMAGWFKQYVAGKARGRPGTPRPTPVRGPIVPTGAGARASSAPDAMAVLTSGKGGNIGGIKHRGSN